jgi:EAL domain-containing protein (putative c-di-GMP-specific phosphodiesterase class I)/putative methionine-R-sulfoxide reductase with GAF domain
VAGLPEAIQDLIDPTVLMRRVVEQALALIPAAEGATVELADEGQLTNACGAGKLAEHVGMRIALEGSLSGLAVRTVTTLRCDDARSDPRVNVEASLRVGAISMVCVPLVRDGEPFGVLKVSAPRPGAFTPADTDVLTRLAAFVSATIAAAADLARITGALLAGGTGRASASAEENGTAEGSSEHAAIREFVANVLRPGLADDLETRVRIERVLAARDVEVVFQPLIDLRNGTLVGAESLARFRSAPAQPPNVWFAQAERVGLGVELELLAVELALRAIDRVPAGAYLAINVGPATLATPELVQRVQEAGAGRIVLELTEHLEVHDYPRLRRALQALREQGARLAVDDTGAGFASLGHILKLAPDIIKVDRELIAGIDLDPVRRALARALVSLATETGATVIAEGLETEDELQTVRALGIHHGQGYLIGRPGPVRTLARLSDRAGLAAKAPAPARR